MDGNGPPKALNIPPESWKRCERCHHWHPSLMPCEQRPMLSPADLSSGLIDTNFEFGVMMQRVMTLEQRVDELERMHSTESEEEHHEQQPGAERPTLIRPDRESSRATTGTDRRASTLKRQEDRRA